MAKPTTVGHYLPAPPEPLGHVGRSVQAIVDAERFADWWRQARDLEIAARPRTTAAR
jgi:hypothetical protein